MVSGCGATFFPEWMEAKRKIEELENEIKRLRGEQ